MKKITILVFMSLMAMVSLAQDIIITKEKEKIDAKVIEVSDAIIKYKKSSHIDGPTFVIEADKVVCITYENGDVDLMTTTNQNISNDNNIGYITKTDNVYTLYTKNGTIIRNLTNSRNVSDMPYKAYRVKRESGANPERNCRCKRPRMYLLTKVSH